MPHCDRTGFWVTAIAMRTVHVSASSENGEVREFDLEKDVLVGRADDCDITVDDSRASRRDIALGAREHGDYLVQDLGSSNGTLLNGHPLISPTRLHHGDAVRIGETTLTNTRNRLRPALPDWASVGPPRGPGQRLQRRATAQRSRLYGASRVSPCPGSGNGAKGGLLKDLDCHLGCRKNGVRSAHRSSLALAQNI